MVMKASIVINVSMVIMILNVSVVRDCDVWLYQSPNHAARGQGSIATATGSKMLMKPYKCSTQEEQQKSQVQSPKHTFHDPTHKSRAVCQTPRPV